MHVGHVEAHATRNVGLEVHRATHVAAAAHGRQLPLTAHARTPKRVALDAMAESATDDVINFGTAKAALARIPANRGQLEKAEELPRCAIDYAFCTDVTVARAEALLALTRIPAARRRPPEPTKALEQAIELSEQTAATRAAERARELAAELAAARS